jgi:hypothetical protein
MANYDYSSGGFPTSPATNDTLIVHGTSYTYDGTGWVVSAGANGLTSSATAPSSPTVGDQWFHTTDGILFTYMTDGTDSDWIDISSANGLAASGSLILVESQVVTSSVASVEFTTPLTQYDKYFLTGSGMDATVDGFVELQIKKNNSFVTASYNSSFQFQSVSSTSLYSQVHTSSSNAIIGMVNTNLGSSFQAYLSNGKGGAEFIYDSDAAKEGGSFARLIGKNNASNSYGVQGLKLVASTGSFVSGTFTLFGIKES